MIWQVFVTKGPLSYSEEAPNHLLSPNGPRNAKGSEDT